MNNSPIEVLHGNQLTPVDLEALRKFWEGLCAVRLTLQMGAPAGVYISISKGLYDLLESHYGRERFFQDVIANLWVQEPKTIKQGGDVRTKKGSNG